MRNATEIAREMGLEAGASDSQPLLQFFYSDILVETEKTSKKPGGKFTCHWLKLKGNVAGVGGRGGEKEGIADSQKPIRRKKY